jgi:aryl-alcohol dehydrogenase-like predicted oxidoreductase
LASERWIVKRRVDVAGGFDLSTNVKECQHRHTRGHLYYGADRLRDSGTLRLEGESLLPGHDDARRRLGLGFWAALVALQIEYSLLERTAEGDLIPMAREMGLGVTPWSPLRGGALTGKYTRENAATLKPDRGERVSAFLNEKGFAVVDELVRIGNEIGAAPAAVALAWVQGKPGVASTIIGARRLDQLEQNLSALEAKLGADQIAALDKVSRPELSFPANFLGFATTFMHAGATVNGVPSQLWPLSPKSDADRY